MVRFILKPQASWVQSLLFQNAHDVRNHFVCGLVPRLYQVKLSPSASFLQSLARWAAKTTATDHVLPNKVGKFCPQVKTQFLRSLGQRLLR